MSAGDLPADGPNKKGRAMPVPNEMVSPIPTKRYAEWGLFFLGDLS